MLEGVAKLAGEKKIVELSLKEEGVCNHLTACSGAPLDRGHAVSIYRRRTLPSAASGGTGVCGRPVGLVTPTTCARRAYGWLLVVTALAGCGSSGHPHAATLDRGRAVFAQRCAACHTLTGHDTQVRGGDLAIARLSAAEIAGFAHVMPVRLSPGDLAAVAAYVHSVAARRASPAP
jgi:hypothetical protein